MTDQEMLAAIAANPGDDTPKLVYADYLDEHGGDGRLWRELVTAYHKVSAVPPRRRPPTPDDWDAAVGTLPPELHSWYAAGCAVRCALWPAAEFAAEQLEDVRMVLTDMTVPLWSPKMITRADAAQSWANAAWSRADAARSRADAARSRADAARSRAYAAWSRADAAWSRANAAQSWANAAWSRTYAARSRADAARSRVDAAQSRTYAAWSRADAAWSRANAAWSRANAAETRWQATWLEAVTAVAGVGVPA